MKQKEVKWLFSLLLMLVITITGYSQNQKTFEFTIEGMTCQGCVNTATQTLKKVKGVDSVSVDLDSKRAFVVTNSNVTIDDLKKSLEAGTNFEALFSGETLPQPLTEEEKKGLDIKTIKGGDKINCYYSAANILKYFFDLNNALWEKKYSFRYARVKRDFFC